jgi:hypothetical protein
VIDGLLRGMIDLPALATSNGVPGRDRFAVGGLNARFSGEFDVNRAA